MVGMPRDLGVILHYKCKLGGWSDGQLFEQVMCDQALQKYLFSPSKRRRNLPLDPGHTQQLSPMAGLLMTEENVYRVELTWLQSRCDCDLIRVMHSDVFQVSFNSVRMRLNLLFVSEQ